MSIKNYGLITSVDELHTFTERLIAATAVGFDIETGYAGEDRPKFAVHPETAFVVGVSFTCSTDWARYIPLAHDEGENLDPREVAAWLWMILSRGTGVAHNAGFELRHLARFFREHLSEHPEHGWHIKRTNGYFPVRSCTQVEAYLAAEHERFGLKYLTEKVFGHKQPALIDLFPGMQKGREKMLRFNTLPLSALVVEYACEDAAWCLALHERYYERVCRMPLYAVEMAIVREVLPPMEDYGIRYDWAYLARGAEALRGFRDRFNAEIMTELSAMTGETIAINLASSVQLSKILFDKLGYRVSVYTDSTKDLPADQRKMSTGKIALERLAKDHEVVEKIRLWRQMTRLLGTYLEKYEGLYQYADDGHAHPSHLASFVVTGRFAVSEPPYQQCLPGHYQVLTLNGWVRLDALDDFTRVAQYHGDTEELEFVLPEEVVRNDHEGMLIRLTGGEIGSWQYTPNHRLMYRTRDRRNGGLSEVKEATAREWFDSLRQSNGGFGRCRLDRQHITAGHQKYGVRLTEDERRELRLAVAIQADGTRTNGHQWDIAVHRERKVKALRELGLEPEPQSRGRWRTRVPRARFERWLDEDKNFKAEAILTLSHADLDLFIDEVMQWDGDSTRGATYTQNNARAASVDVVQAAAALCGYTTSLYYRTEYNAVTVNLHDSATKGSGWQEPEEHYYSGKVYCVTVPTGMFLCRNGQGKVMVTGNSPKKYHFDLIEAKAAHAAGQEPPDGTCFRFNFRDAIIAPPDHYILGFDLSQAELRAIAGEAQETALLKAFASGEDVHRLTAALMLKIPVHEVTDQQRSIGKTMNFALLYGMGVKSLADRLALDVDEAQALYDKYFAVYSNIAAWSQNQVRTGRTHGFVTSHFGRRLPIWQFASEQAWKQQEGERACVNYPIQGAATGDYMKIAMVQAHRAIRAAGMADKIRLVMNVHDALEFYVHRSVNLPDAVRILQPAVVFPVEGWPAMQADWHVAKRWGSPTEVKVKDDGTVVIQSDVEYEMKPTIEIDEETGEVIEVLPEVDRAAIEPFISQPETPQPAEQPDASRTVQLHLDDMPEAKPWSDFLALMTHYTGEHRLVVRTPEGDIEPVDHGVAMTPDDTAAVSLCLRMPVRISWAADDVDHAALVQGMQF